MKALADRNGICLLVIHHLRKMADDDPFNRLSGTNGLAGAADGTLILMRNKRQDGTAILYATGRDIEDVEEELELADCRWSRAVPQEQLRLTLVVNALKKLLSAGAFRGTATELVTRLETQGNYWSPAILSKYLQSHDEALAKCGILLETKRTNSKRLLCLRDEGQAGDACDTSDGSEGCDRYSPCRRCRAAAACRGTARGRRGRVWIADQGRRDGPRDKVRVWPKLFLPFIEESFFALRTSADVSVRILLLWGRGLSRSSVGPLGRL